MFKEFNLNNLENSKDLLEDLLNENRKKVSDLLEIENKTYKNFVLPFQEIGESINDFLTPIFHIDSVKNSEITTKVYEECIPVISKYETEISQNENIYSALVDIQSKEKDTFVFGWAKMLIVSLAHDIGKIEKIESLRGLSSFEKGKYEHNTHENLSRLIISNAFPGYKYVEEVCEIIEKHHIQVVDEKNKNYKEIKKLKFADQEARRLEIKNYLTTKKDTSIINQKPKEPISELVQKEEDNPIKESTPKEEVMDVFNNAENAVKEDTSIVIEAKNEEDKSEQNIKINIDENIEISQAEKPIKLPNNDDMEKEKISSEKKVHTIKEDGYNEVLDMEAFGSFIQSLVSSINTTEMTSQKRLRPVSISDKDELFVPVEIYLKLLKNAKFDVSDKKKIDMVTRQLKTDGVLKYETSKIALDGFSNFAYKQRRTYFVFSLDFLNVTQDEVALKKRNEENLRNVSIVRS